MHFDPTKVPSELVDSVARAMHGANHLSALRMVRWEDAKEGERSHWLFLANAALLAVCGFTGVWPMVTDAKWQARCDKLRLAENAIRAALEPLPEGYFVKAHENSGSILVSNGMLAFAVTEQQIEDGITDEVIKQQLQALIEQTEKAQFALRAGRP